jgi:hypothetical protein
LDAAIINRLDVTPACAQAFTAHAAQHHHTANERSLAFLNQL